jgi:hypothetical protein
MLTKTKFAFAAALLAAGGPAALAQGFAPNLANRYPSHAGPTAQAPHASLHSAPVRLRQERDVSATGQPSDIDADRTDRASSPDAGGGF